MKSTTTRPSAVSAGLAACALALATLLSGCGTGQHSQTADQAPAVDGSEATTKDIALRDVRIQAQQSGDFLQPGTSVELVMVVANDSLETVEHLVDVTTPIGKVTLSPKKPEVPVAGRLLIGTPAGQTRTPKQDNVTNATAMIELAKPITNGINYDFTFEFEKVGTIKLAVPVSAGLEPQQVPAD